MKRYAPVWPIWLREEEVCMHCPIENRDTAEILLGYCAQKLDAKTAAVLEAHIEICPACREFAEAQKAVWKSLDAWEAAPVSRGFRPASVCADREGSLAVGSAASAFPAPAGSAGIADCSGGGGDYGGSAAGPAIGQSGAHFGNLRYGGSGSRPGRTHFAGNGDDAGSEPANAPRGRRFEDLIARTLP